MTIAFDKVTYDAQQSATSPINISHTPVGTPRAVIVTISDNSTASVTGVTYDGAALTQMTSSPLTSAGESGSVQAWFLGSGLSTGAVTVAVTHGGENRFRAISVITVTAAADCEENNTNTIGSTGLANPSGTLTLGGTSSFVTEVWYTGDLDATTCVALTNWGADVSQTLDFGSDGGGAYSYDIVGTSDVTFGYTNASVEDAYVLAVAINEIAAGAATPKGPLGHVFQGPFGGPL